MATSEFAAPKYHQSLSDHINSAYRMDEQICVEERLSQAALSTEALHRISSSAYQLVLGVRKGREKASGIDAFMVQYHLSSEEGIALMCLAEALLRIPDKVTADKLIRDKVGSADWQAHIGKSSSMFVNAATWGLMLTGKVVANTENGGFSSVLKGLTNRLGRPTIRTCVAQAMKILGQQFVMGRTIEEALDRATDSEQQGYCYSYDMLGEAACTEADAERYFQAYHKAIQAIGAAANGRGPMAGPGISIKLSALHPRYEMAKRERVLQELTPRLLDLAKHAKLANIGLTVDAEESERLELSLEIIEAVFCDPSLSGWEGFGLAVQSYQKRAMQVLDWLDALAQKQQRRFMVRLIKGAYWDSEIKVSQVNGLEGYPVFTRKASTDVSFLACAKRLLASPSSFYPQFATHNAYSLAAVLELTQGVEEFECQCLHGMGRELYDQIVGADNKNVRVRIYAPVGHYDELLAYLVRRLLENGANSSFVNRVADDSAPIESLIADPVAMVSALDSKHHPHIPLPVNLYGKPRKNSASFDLSNTQVLQQLFHNMREAAKEKIVATPMLAAGEGTKQKESSVTSPAQHSAVVGHVVEADSQLLQRALDSAEQARADWDNLPVEQRAGCLDKAAELLEQRYPEFMSLAIREAGKTVEDALAEVREAVDFCRYYAKRARKDLAVPKALVGPTGEHNQLSLHGRGTIACISPWNFPLAIFMGQVTAALVAGNTVIAKPAEQTPLIAAKAVALLHEAGVPVAALQLLPGRGDVLGAGLVADERISGVMFTGSTETARHINNSLAKRQGAIVPLIAETGGQNVMIVDSSALPEQVVQDVIGSAFGSAGQRCSACRVLFLQEDIADKFIEMLQGAMAELKVGDPSQLDTDVGPVIDQQAQQQLQKHIKKITKQGKLLYRSELDASTNDGTFVAPTAVEIDSLSQLEREVFGPVLHVIRYAADDLDKVLDEINACGYGLTLGIHSRIDETVEYIHQRVKVGNTYVNRNMIGAVVGVQPFGGEGLSGTGPKAGGPHYLPRLCTERTLSVNTAAAGGNASLLSLSDE